MNHQQSNVQAALLMIFILASLSLPRICAGDNANNLLELDLKTLTSLEVSPSADASITGLSKPYPGDLVAYGAREGFLGTRHYMDSGFSITSYTRKATEDWQAKSIGGVLQYDPSVRVTRGFGNFQQAYWIRGMPVFSDDMAYNGLFGILPRQYLSAQFIERLEVLRGVSAFLSGLTPTNISGLGGAINVLPKRALNQDLSNFTVGINSGNEHEMSMDIGRRFNAGRLGIRLNTEYRSGDTEVAGERTDLDMVSLGLDYFKYAFRFSAELALQNHRLEGSTPSIDIDTGLKIPTAPTSTKGFAQPWTYSSEKDILGTVRAEIDVATDVTFWFAAGLREGKEDARFSAFATVTDVNGDFSASRFDVVREDLVASGELGLSYLFSLGDVRHKVSFSASGIDNKSKNAYSIFDAFASNIYQADPVSMPMVQVFGNGDMASPKLALKVQSHSFAVADQVSLLSSKLMLTMGARYQVARELNYDANGNNISRYDEGLTTPVFSTLYRISPEWSVYGNLIQGLEKGVVAPETNNMLPVANAGESTGPYRVKQKEVGIKWDSGALGGSINLYDVEKPVAGYDLNNKLTIVDEETSRGSELLVFGEPVAGIRIVSGLNYLEAKSSVGQRIGIARHQANFNVEWDTPFNGLTMIGQYIYTGEFFADDLNDQKVPSWTRLDLGVRYQIPLFDDSKLVIRAKLENTTNENYWASAGGYPGQGYLTLGSPRTLRLNTSFEF
ncbi:MAG: TonB-dependent receptor [Pseudomonadales bacterium]|nr:TonB-dependent receptor [Pseudomonadales bacterium]